MGNEGTGREADRDAGLVPRLHGVDPQAWDSLLVCFADASLFQSRAYGEVRWGAQALEHWVLEAANGDLLGAAQVRRMGLPLLGDRIAYVTHGPLWRPAGTPRDPRRLRSILEALRRVYVVERGFLLRVAPSEFDQSDPTLGEVLESAGFHRQRGEPTSQTLRIDLQPELDDLRKALKKKWRESLNRAERRNMEVLEGTSEEFYREFESVYREMHARKGFAEFVDVEEFRRMCAALSTAGNMRILVCRAEGQTASALVWSAFGDTGVIHFSATAGAGLKLRGSYLLRWRALEGMKRAGIRYLDQGGVDPSLNPGSYAFKQGFGGDLVSQLGVYDACDRRWLSGTFDALTWLRARYRHFRRS